MGDPAAANRREPTAEERRDRGPQHYGEHSRAKLHAKASTMSFGDAMYVDDYRAAESVRIHAKRLGMRVRTAHLEGGRFIITRVG